MSRTTNGYATVFSALLILSSAGGCTLVAQLDETDGIPACESGSDRATRDLILQVREMDVHLGDLVEVRVVNQNDFVVTRAVFDGFPSPEFTLRLRDAVLEGPHRVDVFADLSGDRVYEAPPVDHSWRLAPCASGAYRLTHNGNFADLEQPAPRALGGDFVIRFAGMGIHLGQLLELYVIHGTNRRMVGYYRLTEVTDDAFTLTLPGIIEPGVPYVAAFYADKSNNLVYDPPDIDHAWRVQGTGDASGWSVDFVHNLQFTDIGEDLER